MNNPVSSPKEIWTLFTIMAALAWIISDSHRWPAQLIVWVIMMFPVIVALYDRHTYNKTQRRLKSLSNPSPLHDQSTPLVPFAPSTPPGVPPPAELPTWAHQTNPPSGP